MKRVSEICTAVLLYGHSLHNEGVDFMKRLLLLLVILIGFNLYSDEVNTYIDNKVDEFMNETVFGGLEFPELNATIE